MKRKVLYVLMALSILCYTLIFYADTNYLSKRVMSELRHGRLRFYSTTHNTQTNSSLPASSIHHNPEPFNQSAADRLNAILLALEEKSRKIKLAGYRGNKHAHLIAKIGETKIISVNPGNRQDETQNVLCGDYRCALVIGGPLSGVDMVLFTLNNIEYYKSPPNKSSNDIWAFKSMKPQWTNDVPMPSRWDGMFNYSLTYLSYSKGANDDFTDQIQLRVPQLTRNFAELRRQRRLNALSFTSDCIASLGEIDTSASSVYIKELSKYMEIDVFSVRDDSCRENIGSFNKKKTEKIPKMSSYSFFLSFEDSLCKDYISEKFWNVLETDEFTIPVVLGGLSVDEYERVAPPNSFIHVKNFTSPKALAMHLHHVVYDADAYNYYLQWRNEYTLTSKGMYTGSDCYFCRLAHEGPNRVWTTFSKDFGSPNCLDVTSQLCPYYNISC